MAASSQLAFLLTHQLAKDDAGSRSEELVAPTLLNSLRLVERAEAEEERGEKGSQGIIHRWTLRLSSLISSSKSGEAQSLGFILAYESSVQSEALFLSHARVWFTAALSLLVSKKGYASADAILPHASRFLLLCFEKAQHLPEFSREVANPAAARKVGESLLAVAASEDVSLSTRISLMSTLGSLLAVSPTPLRPIAPQIQALAIHHLCLAPSSSARQSAIRLLSSVHLSAGKANAGNSWKKTVEALLGSGHTVLDSLVDTFVEEYGHPAALAPLSLPPLSGGAPLSQGEALHPLYMRFEALVDALVYMLANPTERAVPIPLGSLVQMAQRILSLTVQSPSKERADQNMRAAQMALLPRLHVQGCRLLGQIASCCGTYLTTYATQLLAQISFALSSYPSGSPTRLSFYSLTSLLSTHVPLHPDDASRSLCKIVRDILEDSALVLLDERTPPKAIEQKINGDGQRKAKKARLAFETDQAMSTNKRRVGRGRVDEVVHALDSLDRILASPASYLLSPSLLNLTLRFLLSCCLHPSFFSSLSSLSASSSSSSLFSSALSHPTSLRTRLLSCLLSSLTSNPSAPYAPHYLEHALNIFRTGMSNGAEAGLDAESREICKRGVEAMESVMRPVVPRVLKTNAMRTAARELSGGSVDRKGKAPEVVEEEQVQHEDGQEQIQTLEAGTAAPAASTTATASTSTATAVAPPVPQSNKPRILPPTRERPTLPAPETASIAPPAAAAPSFSAAAITASTPQTNEAAGNTVEEEDLSMVEDAQLIQPLTFTQLDVGVSEQPVAAPAASKAEAAEDSDSDDDAPMPTINMSDDEDDL